MPPFFERMKNMTVGAAIKAADHLRANHFCVDEKLKWISRLDGKIANEVLQPRSDIRGNVFKGYTQNDIENELLVPYPYDELYVYYLISQIDYYNAEISRYNNSSMMFNNAYNEFEAAYNRDHMVAENKKFKW